MSLLSFNISVVSCTLHTCDACLSFAVLHCYCGGFVAIQCPTATSSFWCVHFTSLLWWWWCYTVCRCYQLPLVCYFYIVVVVLLLYSVQLPTDAAVSSWHLLRRKQMSVWYVIHSPLQNNHNEGQCHRHRHHNIINNNKWLLFKGNI